MDTIATRLSQLRDVMRRERIAAFIVPSTDAHQSEYVAAHWQSRCWISGFDGSAGTVVVTQSAAALWTDSRYFLAAEQQLSGTEYRLMRLKMAGTPTVAEWIAECLEQERQSRDAAYYASTEVAIDGTVWSAADVEALQGELRRQGGLTLRTNLDPFASIWTDRPAIPSAPVEIQPIAYAGESCPSKLKRIRRSLRQLHADGMLVSALDDIAWTLNLRGTDVHCTPVFVAYLLISTTDTTLFINKEKLTPAVSAYLAECGVQTDDYRRVTEGLRHYFEQTILLDPAETNIVCMKAAVRDVIRHASPIPAMKIVKNEVEQRGLREAHLRDGVAMREFLAWLDANIGRTRLTEMSVDRRLTELRSRQPLYRDLSFDTICGYADHGAIVHYEATEATDRELQPRGLLLLDSGAQYQDGTTDITRTIALGPLTDEERHVYTLVLKGHIALSRAVFPEGTAGTQLDVLARQFMWREGLNYLHGTGHGVGSYLSVHEGPHQFRMEWKPQPLVAGMTITVEPGIYLPGKFGVRIENTMLITEAFVNDEGIRYLRLEPLTCVPIDTRPVDFSMLTDDERQWLEAYNASCL